MCGLNMTVWAWTHSASTLPLSPAHQLAGPQRDEHLTFAISLGGAKHRTTCNDSGVNSFGRSPVVGCLWASCCMHRIRRCRNSLCLATPRFSFSLDRPRPRGRRPQVVYVCPCACPSVTVWRLQAIVSPIQACRPRRAIYSSEHKSDRRACSVTQLVFSFTLSVVLSTPQALVPKVYVMAGHGCTGLNAQ